MANFSDLLKEGETVRFSGADQVVICSCLVTVEYCLEATSQLEDKMKQKVEASLAEQISFSGELDMFHSVTGNCVGLLVQELDCACDQFVSTFIPKFISNLYKCKPVGTVGAEQLLLDTHSLKTVLVEASQVTPAPGGRKGGLS